MQSINRIGLEQRIEILTRRLKEEREDGYDWYPMTAAELAEAKRKLNPSDPDLAELDELAKIPCPPIEDPTLYGPVFD